MVSPFSEGGAFGRQGVSPFPAGSQAQDDQATAEALEKSRTEALATLRLRLDSQKAWCSMVAGKVQALQETARKAEEAEPGSSSEVALQIAEAQQEAAAAQTLCAALESQKAELEESEAFGKSAASKDMRAGPY